MALPKQPSFYQERQTAIVQQVGRIFCELVLHSTPISQVRREVIDMLKASGITLQEDSLKIRIETLLDKSSLWQRIKAEVYQFGDVDQTKFDILIMIAKTLEDGGFDAEKKSYRDLMPIIEFGSLPIPRKVIQQVQECKIVPPLSFSNPTLEAIESLRFIPVKILRLDFGSGPDFQLSPQYIYQGLLMLSHGVFPVLEQISIAAFDGYTMETAVCDLLKSLKKSCPRLQRLHISGFQKCLPADLEILRNAIPEFSYDEKILKQARKAYTEKSSTLVS